ncbi:MAG: ChaN family lipoprotein [Thermodesulfobacteriota bacterium]
MIDRFLEVYRGDLWTWGLLFLSMILFSGCGMDRPMRRMKHPVPAPEITAKDYRIFDREGNPAAFEDIIKAAAEFDAVFIGEAHGDPAAHHLEKKILTTLYARYGSAPEKGGTENRPKRPPKRPPRRPIVLSLEMFERDVQVILDEYLQDLITERHFLAGSRPWPRYRRDYRPLVEFAKEKEIPVIAANAPRRYVNRVSRLGPESLTALSKPAQSWLPPLPYPPASPEYRRKFLDFWGETMGIDPENMARAATESDTQSKASKKSAEPRETKPSHPSMADTPPKFENLLNAQSLWDAAQGHAVAEALNEHPGALAVNINGKFHSAENLGAPEKLRYYRPGTDILTVTIIPAESYPEFDDRYLGYGDFIILTDPDFTRAKNKT